MGFERAVNMGGVAKKAVGKKIAKLMKEGKPQKQAIAESLSMKRAGRLTAKGGYIRKGK